MDSDLNAVVLFEKVAELRSFRAAARTLGVPHSTLSLKISQLEERLGARLFERSTRSVRVTDAGNAYYRQVAPALQAIRDGDRVVSGLLAEPSGSLRWTAPREFDPRILGDTIAEYAGLYPKVRMAIELTDRRVNLIEEGFDLALRAGPLNDSSLISRALGSPQRLHCYASPRYLRRHGRPRHPKELCDHNCLVMSGHLDPNHWHFLDGRNALTIEVRPHIIANSFAILRRLVENGAGIARLPAPAQPARAKLPGATIVLEEFSPRSMRWHALYPSGKNVSANVRALLELLEKNSSSPVS